MIAISGIHQCAILPYRVNNDRLEVLLVTSRGTKRWILPKGNVEPGLTARESAEYEAYEEAGVAGAIGPRVIGTYAYRKRREKGGALCRVRVYPMEVDQEFQKYPDAKDRNRRWVSIEKAQEMVLEDGLRSVLAKFARRHA